MTTETREKIRAALEQLAAIGRRYGVSYGPDAPIHVRLHMLRSADEALALLSEPDDEADWRTVLPVLDAARRCLKARDQDPHEMRVLDALKIACAIAERHINKEGGSNAT